MGTLAVSALPSCRWWTVAVLALSATLAQSTMRATAQTEHYDGPTFAKGLWRFERSFEVSSQNRVMPNARRVRVDQPVTRCVDPTEAMKETFRPGSVGNCRSSAPQKHQNTYHFANRCDYLGPVQTMIVIESSTSYRETNEFKGASAGKKEVVVARRIGECERIPDLPSHPTQFDSRDPSSYYNYHPSPR
jgi:hypothetical protein